MTLFNNVNSVHTMANKTNIVVSRLVATPPLAIYPELEYFTLLVFSLSVEGGYVYPILKEYLCFSVVVLSASVVRSSSFLVASHEVLHMILKLLTSPIRAPLRIYVWSPPKLGIQRLGSLSNTPSAMNDTKFQWSYMTAKNAVSMFNITPQTPE